VTNVNPPADAAEAGADPAIILTSGPAEARVTARHECATRPQPCAFRYAVLRDGDGGEYAGYLWER
jgi:hypothetical protein